MTVTSAQVQTLLTDILGETTTSTANATDLSEYLALSNNLGFSTPASLAAQIANSPEAGIAQQVYRLYEAVLGRAPDAGGLQNWVTAAEAGLTTAQIQAGVSSVSQATWNSIINGFTASAEFQAKYSGIGGSALVDLLYANILGRTPDATGLETWTSILGSSVAGAGPTPAAVIEVVNGIVNSAEFIKDSLANNTAATVAAALADTGTGPTYTVTPVTVAGTTTPLTTGIDTLNLSGSNNTVSGTFEGVQSAGTAGTGATFGAGDQIIGAAGSSGNVLNLSDLSTGGSTNPFGIAGVTISNIQTINVTTSQAFGASGASVATGTSVEGLSGLTQLNIKDIGGTYVNVGSTTGVSVTDLSQGTNNEQVEGGANVTITTTGDAASANNNGKIVVGQLVNAIGTATSTPTGTVTITEQVLGTNGGAEGVINVIGGTAVNITTTSGTTADTQYAGGNISVTGTAITTSVTVNQAAAATASSAAAGFTDGTVTITDANAGSANKAATISAVTLSNYATNSSISSNALATLTLSGATTGSTTLSLTEGLATPTNTTLTLNVNGLGTSSYTGIVDDTSNQFQTLKIVATGSNQIDFQDTALKTVTISGTGSLAADLTNAGGNAQLTTVTDTATGVSALTIGTGASFNGAGSGQDIITLSGATTGTIAGGSASNNELIANFSGNGVTSLGTVTGFTELGFGANSSGTFDLSKLTGFTSLAVSGDIAGGVVVDNVTAGTGLAIATTTMGAFTYETADTNGASDSLNVTLGTAAGSGVTVSSLVAEDSSGNGYGTLKIASTYTASGIGNVITSLDSSITAKGISALTITGNAALTIAGWTDDATSLTITDTSTSTGANSYTLSDGNLTSLAITGSTTGSQSLALTDGGSNTAAFTLTDSSAGAVSVTLPATLVDASLTVSDSATANLSVSAITIAADTTTVTLTNTGSGTLSDAGFTGAVLATFNIAGSGAQTDTLISSGNGALTVNDSATGAATITTLTDTAAGTLQVNDTGSGALTVTTLTGGSATTVTLDDTGSGNVTVSGGTLAAVTTYNLENTGSGTLSVTNTLSHAGPATVDISGTGTVKASLTDTSGALTVSQNGNSNVTLTLAHNGETATVTLGNGNNTVTDSSTATSSGLSLTVGTGSNTIDVGASHDTAATITFGTANGGSATSLSTINHLGVFNTDQINWATATDANNTTIYAEGAVGSIASGLAEVSATDGYSTFTYNGNTYVYENTGTASSSELVALVGTHTFNAAAGHLVITS